MLLVKLALLPKKLLSLYRAFPAWPVGRAIRSNWPQKARANSAAIPNAGAQTLCPGSGKRASLLPGTVFA